MNKSELIEAVTNKSSYLNRRETKIIVDLIFNSMAAALAEGSKIEIRGFGSFKVKPRSARIGRNPKTGDKVEVPAKNIPFFKVGKDLKMLVDH